MQDQPVQTATEINPSIGERPTVWDSLNWKSVYRRSIRPVRVRGFSDALVADYISGSAVVMVLIALFSLAFPVIQVPWNWFTISLVTASTIWLAWCFWPAIERICASRFVIRARVLLKPSPQFWQRSMYPVEFFVKSAFRITPKGSLIPMSSWKGKRQFSIPAWLYHIVDEQDELDLVCLSSNKILGELDHFIKPH